MRELFVVLLGTAMVAACATTLERPVNVDARGVAIHGYDPVAYFTDGRPVPGESEHSLEWKGATWWFASEDHRTTFAKDPEAYAPRYGGYCAYAVARNTIADVDPHAWAIVDGRLYLNLDDSIATEWAHDRERNIRDADAHWPELLNRMEDAP